MTKQASTETALAIFAAALAAVAPAALVRPWLPEIRRRRNRAGGRLVCLAVGKAAAAMAAPLGEDHDLDPGGVLVTTDGSLAGPLPGTMVGCAAGHPLPDERSEKAASAALAHCTAAGPGDLVLCLISGGGSALLAAPAPGLTLADKQHVTSLLLRSGAPVDELNAVRKHLSRVKGGRLAAATAPAAVLALILSDVVGSPLDVIASGPTAPDPSTWADAAAVLARRLPAAAVPPAVAALVARGVAGEVADTPKPGDPLFAAVANHVVADNATALAAAAAAADRAGLAAEIATAPVVGEARDAGRTLARRAAAATPGRCLLSGGETTVTVTGAGRGGRSLELALAFALAVAGRPGITLLAAGSDGRDGPTDAAGAVVTGGTIAAARARGLDPEGALAANDAYSFFAAAGGLLRTGPTGTNVMDLQVVVIGPDETPTGPLTLP